MEKLYLFVLGRDPELSIIEIESFLQSKNINYEILDTNKNIAAIKLSQFETSFVDYLGGTIKVGEVISNTNKLDEIEENLELSELYKGTKNKINYYISGFSTDLTSFVEDFLKDYFKKIKLKALYRKETTPSSIIKKEILKEGLDLIIYKNFIARTIAVSNLIELKQRDIQRPSVDYMKSISLRLAKILINLSKIKENETLLDPFCGSGSILQEAMLNNINVIGIDKDKESIKQSSDNLEWLKENYPIKANYRLFNLDSRKMSSVVSKVDAVVTEPYLGPYIRKLPNIEEAKSLIFDLTNLYSSIIKQSSEILGKGKRLIIIIPRLKTVEGKTLYIDIRSLVEQNKFYLVYEPVIYAYSKSKIIREICVLEKH